MPCCCSTQIPPHTTCITIIFLILKLQASSNQTLSIWLKPSALSHLTDWHDIYEYKYWKVTPFPFSILITVLAKLYGSHTHTHTHTHTHNQPMEGQMWFGHYVHTAAGNNAAEALVITADAPPTHPLHTPQEKKTTTHLFPSPHGTK